MALSARSATSSGSVADIDYLASCIVRAAGDPSVEPQARALAQYMLVCREMSPDVCAELVARPGAKRAIDKLLDCESEFMGPTPRAAGIDLVVSMTANKIQRSLDVKHHYRKSRGTEGCLDGRITPKIQDNILYTNVDFMWLRVHRKRAAEVKKLRIPETKTFRSYDQAQKYVRNTRGSRIVGGGADYTVTTEHTTDVFKVCDNVYEIYVAKTSPASDTLKLNHLLCRYGANNAYSLIFCSELKRFRGTPLLFISNYVKFHYCYHMKRDVFDPSRYDELRAAAVYTTQCALFMDTANLTNMPPDTHGPLVAYTGERPKVLMSKFRDDAGRRRYVNEGTRAMQSVDRGSDLGARSNYVEVVSKVRLDPGVLDYIV